MRSVRLQGTGGGGWAIGSLRGARGRLRSRGKFDFTEPNDALVGNFPAEVALFAALLEMMLEEDGTAGIGDENAGSGQKNIASAILHFHTTPEEG